MKFLIIKNKEKMMAQTYTELVCNKITELGGTAVLYDDLSVTPILKGQYDMIISVGGDGTIIHAFKKSMGSDIPILGFNLGRLGFLANLEKTELSRLEDIMKGNFKTEQRMLIDAVFTVDGVTKQITAVNDIVISKDSYSKMIDFDVTVDRKHYVAYRADGLITATPTGSTAYSMSAGGPIIDPENESLLLTPICPLSMRTQTTVFSKNCVIEIQPTCRADSESILVADGLDPVILAGSTVTIKKSSFYFPLVKFSDKSFYETVNKKIWNGR